MLARGLISHPTFKGIGKAQFLNCFFQHASFIGGKDMPGSMEEVSTNNRASGFLSFLRLIGTVYFKKHLASFISIHNIETPQQLYNSIDSITPEDKHKSFMNYPFN